MSNSTNSAPALLQICGMPGEKNSKTIAPKQAAGGERGLDGIVGQVVVHRVVEVAGTGPAGFRVQAPAEPAPATFSTRRD